MRMAEGVIGILIILVTMFDFFWTTITVGGGGPITTRTTRWMWLLLLCCRRWLPHRVMNISGFLIVLMIMSLWVVLLWTGWTLVFLMDPHGIVHNATNLPADTLERVYFTGSTLFTLGIGDYLPADARWGVATAVATANGLVMMTLAVTFLVPVVSSASQKRQLAAYISSLGHTPEEIVIRNWNGKDFQMLAQHLVALAPMLTLNGHRHLAYPVLHYFHALEANNAASVAVASLDEALTLMRFGLVKEQRPDPAALETARSAVASFLNTLCYSFINAKEIQPAPPTLQDLVDAGLRTVPQQEFRQALVDQAHRRRLLLALVTSDGWDWDVVRNPYTESICPQ